MIKKEIRKLYIEKRKLLQAKDCREWSLNIAKLFSELPLKNDTIKTIHIFLPIRKNNEVDTWPLIKEAKSKGLDVVVPKVKLGSSDMESYLLKDDTSLIENEWGIPEPSEGTIVNEEKIDVVIIPLLAFDAQGHRVGYGKGFYDRFLIKCRAEVIKVGLSWFPPIEDIEDVSNTDIPLDFALTPKGIYHF